MPILAPSILSADFAELGDEVARVERGGAQYLHVDVMDGHFVPNLTFGPTLLACIRPRTKLFFDVHLMVEEPDGLIPAFAEAGANGITVHVEAVHHLHRTVQVIRHQKGDLKVGVALNPATPLSTLEEILPDIDMVLLMSVNPGFGGQSFIPSVHDKLKRLKRMIDDRRLPVTIEMDGGIGLTNVGSLVADGLDIVVAGSAVFVNHQGEDKARDMLTTMKAARGAAARR